MFLSLFMIILLSETAAQKAIDPLDYVDLKIGTTAAGIVYPGVCRPFGLAKWTPQTCAGEEKGSKPYDYKDTKMQGIRWTNFISGSAVPEYGSATIMVITGELKTDPAERASSFSHDNEQTIPYLYKVEIYDYNITMEYTSTERAGYFRFTFPQSENAYLLIQPNNTPRAKHTQDGIAYIKILPESNEIIGYNPAFRYYISTGKPAGFRDFDTEKAYRYIRKNAMKIPENYDEYADGKGRRAIDDYLKYGYIPLENPVDEAFHKAEQVSRTLEYAYDDFCIAEFASALGKSTDYKMFSKNALNYRNVFDTSAGFVRGRYIDGSWDTPFDPGGHKNYITEATPWVYTRYVPHDVQGLIDLMGGRNQFVTKLDTFFDKGYYLHDNEPSHQITYLYCYSGKPIY